MLDRIVALRKVHRGFGNEELQFYTVLFHAPDDIVPGETSPLLLNRLEALLRAESGEEQQ